MIDGPIGYCLGPVSYTHLDVYKRQFLLYGAYHQFLGEEERATISASIYYFNMGSVDLTKLVGTEVVQEGTAKPNEFSIDVAYGLKLSDTYSMAVTGRYIRSDLSLSLIHI